MEMKKTYSRINNNCAGNSFLRTIVICGFVLLILLASCVIGNADSGIPDGYQPPNYHSIKPYLMRNPFTEETVAVSGIEVRPDKYTDFNDTITLRLFNSTTQETEYIIDATYDFDRAGFFTPDLILKKDHNYIIFVEDKYYQLGTKKYAQALPAENPDAVDGAGLYDFKKDDSYRYEKLEPINVYKRNTADENPFDSNRYSMMDLDRVKGLPVESGGKSLSGIRFRLVSDQEVIETQSTDGRLYADLIEDIQYMVYVDDDKYWIEPFPLSVKDKSEYGEGRYCYDHSTCHRVEKFELTEKNSRPSSTDAQHTAVSINGKAKVSGLQFNDLILIERKLDKASVPADGLSNYFVCALYAVNPHRWEISKIVGNDNLYAVETLPESGTVKGAYEFRKGALRKLGFSQSDQQSVNINIDSLGVYPIVIEYERAEAAEKKTAVIDGNTYDVSSADAGTATFIKSRNSKKVVVPDAVTVNGRTLAVTRIAAKAFTGKKIRSVTVGANVAGIEKNAFKGSKTEKLVVRTRKLTKKSVKGSLKESKVKTVKVKVGNKKLNKKFVKKYKKIFTKKNAGKKVKVK